MNRTSRMTFFVGMVLLTLVSMWTTYVSVNDSILPEPKVPIPVGGDTVWECSVWALFLAVAIGLMLLALKLAIIDEQKRLSPLGLVGLCLLAFISISFNMDVLYRTADKDFFMRYSTSRVKDEYATYLVETQKILSERTIELKKQVALQEGEFEAEKRGLRDLPAGYGRVAKSEEYRLTLLEKEAGVEFESLQGALSNKAEADKVLATSDPQTLDEIQLMQDQLRVLAKDLGAVTGVPLPATVKLDNPLFAVFSKVLDIHTVGLKEVFFLILALLLDLGDIVGYSLVPNKRKRVAEPDEEAAIRDSLPTRAVPQFEGPEVVRRPRMEAPFELDQDRAKELFFSEPGERDGNAGLLEGAEEEESSSRPFRFRQR